MFSFIADFVLYSQKITYMYWLRETLRMARGVLYYLSYFHISVVFGPKAVISFLLRRFSNFIRPYDGWISEFIFAFFFLIVSHSVFSTTALNFPKRHLQLFSSSYWKFLQSALYTFETIGDRWRPHRFDVLQFFTDKNYSCWRSVVDV